MAITKESEVLLEKRKFEDKKRLERKLIEREERESHKLVAPKTKFVRLEQMVMRNRAIRTEEKRLDNVLRHEKRLAQPDEPPKLVFVIRVPLANRALVVPPKAAAVLKVLRLTEENRGVFVRLTPAVVPVLKLVSRYIVVGAPSLHAVRQLFQKRAEIKNPEEDGLRVVKLDNNQVVEDAWEEEGFVCVEDLVHEVYTMGSSFKKISLWLEPFSLSPPTAGYGPLAKLAQLQLQELQNQPMSLAGSVRLQEIDIDKFIEEQT